MRNAIAQLKEGEPILVRFEPVAGALLNEGKVREAFQSYRSLIAVHPKEAVHHLQLAEALLSAGMGEAAREEARLAVRLDPNSALAEKTLANILEYDVVGRKLRPGSDYAGAQAAFRAAEKLDPDDKAITANLAILLEYDDEGVRYASGAKLKEAIAEYESLKPEKLADLGVKNNLAYALFYAGEFADARKNAESLNPQPAGLIVACEAAFNGSRAGLVEAHKRESTDPEFKQVAATAGQMLMNRRMYSVAADLVEAGASGDTPRAPLHWRRCSGRLVLTRIFITMTTRPVSLCKFFLATTDTQMTLEKLNRLLSRNARLGESANRSRRNPKDTEAGPADSAHDRALGCVAGRDN